MRHESNALEEVAGCASRALGLPPGGLPGDPPSAGGLEACHRLDTWTTGLLVLSRSKEANREFKALLEGKGRAAATRPEVRVEGEGRAAMQPEVVALADTATAGIREAGIPFPLSVPHQVVPHRVVVSEAEAVPPADQQSQQPLHKVYKVLTTAQVPLGRLSHFMYDGPFDGGSSRGGGFGSSSSSDKEDTAGGGSKAEAVPGPPQGSPAFGPLLSGGAKLLPRGPRLLSQHAHQGWKRCDLEVLDCRPVPIGAVEAWLMEPQQMSRPSLPSVPSPPATAPSADCRTSAPAGAASEARLGSPSPHLDGVVGTAGQLPVAAGQASTANASAAGADPLIRHPQQQHQRQQDPHACSYFYYQSRVLLLTGRTHQIRAQLAAAGHPLLGDAMYGPIAGLLVGASGRVEDDGTSAHIAGLPQLEGCIGLHSAELEWEGLVLSVPAPWEVL